ncbi:MAG: peptidoglycan-binding protein LysM [Chitinophagales bacterium]|nr:peptidoglycan-binding protein LysM [Bacteroidota bacterium]MCB9042515.1 peptidoglycan-binding protein LysM [Chitinophagales bacterium]
MGLFSFIKEAGAKIFGTKKAAPAPTPEVKAPTLTQEEINSHKADELIDVINDLNIPVESLYVAVDDDAVTIAGKTQSQSDREKVILAVGNTYGVATVDDKLEVDVPEPEAQFYTVQKGDSLSKIAKSVYGDAMKYPEIFEANKPMLSHPDKIYPGQVLRIPNLA